jgi:hypothetical protein
MSVRRVEDITEALWAIACGRQDLPPTGLRGIKGNQYLASTDRRAGVMLRCRLRSAQAESAT